MMREAGAFAVQEAARHIVSRVEDVAHGFLPPSPTSQRRGSWLLAKSPSSAGSSEQLSLSPEPAQPTVTALGSGVQLGFGAGTPPGSLHQPRPVAPNTAQRGAGSWRAYEKEAEALNAQAKADARARQQAEERAERDAALLQQLQAQLGQLGGDGGLD